MITDHCCLCHCCWCSLWNYCGEIGSSVHDETSSANQSSVLVCVDQWEAESVACARHSAVLCMIVGALTRVLSSVIWSVVIGAAVTTLTPQHQTCSRCWPVFWNIEQNYFISYKTQNYFTCCRINNISCELLQLWYIVRRRKACWHSWVLDRVLMTLVTLRQWPGSGDHDQVTMQGWDQSPVSGHNAPYSYHHPLSTSSKSNSYHGEPYIPADVFNVSMTAADALWSPEFTGQYLTIMM